MILRKPYALFIKLFRPMHFVIVALLGVIAYRFYDINSFFKGYVKTGRFSYIEDITTYYVNGSLYFCIIALMALFALIIVLFAYKKKNFVSSVVMLCGQLFCLFFSFVVKSNLTLLDRTNIDIRTAVILRDISILLSLFNLFLLIWMAFRALGFNLKQFEFGKDLKELQIESADSEEFEFSVDIDKNDIKTRWNRYKRLSKYYVTEYRKIILFIVAFLLIIGGLMALSRSNSKGILYKEGTVIDKDSYKYKFKVLDSYIFDKDYKGNTIGDDKYKYAVIKFELTNKTEDDFVFNLPNAVLYTNNSYANIMTLYDKFRDIGIGYNGQKLKTNATGEFIMVYPVDMKDNNSNFILKVFEGNNRFAVQLEPKKFDKIHENSSVNLNEELTITNSVLPKVTFKVNDYKLDSKIIIKDKGIDYAIISNSKENTILMFNYNYSMEESNIYKFSGKQFIASYVKLEASKNGKTKTYDIVDKTPKLVNGIATLEVNKNVVDADTIMLKINIRNEEYYYYLKK